MKNFTLLAVTFLTLSSCSKSNDKPHPAATVEPSIVSVQPYAVNAGGNVSAAFNVSLISDSSTVTKVDMFLLPNQRRWTVDKPSTGKYTMYDRVGHYDRGSVYYFVFTKKDGTTKTSETFMIP